VQWEAGNGGETTPLPAERDTTGILLTDDEIPEEVRADPQRMEVLRLAGWMRAEEPDDRPSARQVEDACRRLRLKLPPPYLREWAESRVPHRNEIAPDNMIGQVLTTSMPSSVFVDPNVTPLSLPASHTTQAPSHTPTLAVGAVVGGISALLGLVLAGSVVAVGLIVWFVVRPIPDPEPPVTDPPPVVADDVDVPPVPPAPEPRVIVVDPAPAKAAPVPAPAAPRPREILVTDPAPTVTPVPAPATPAPPVPTRSAPTGLVVVKTVPPAAVVREKGKVLEKTGAGYVLGLGMHRLEIESPDGEKTVIPVQVRKDQSVEICYDFGTNAKCAAQ
jgi:hypothetical protein